MSAQALADVIDAASEAADLVVKAIAAVEKGQRACVMAGRGPQWHDLERVYSGLGDQVVVLGRVIDATATALPGGDGRA